MISTSASLALNHLLEQQGWARERLAIHAGCRVEFRAPPMPPVRLEIGDTGRVAPADDQPGDLVVTINPLAIPMLLMRNRDALAYIEMAGPAPLAGTVRALLFDLKWDFEEDLSHLVGDAAAHTAAEAGRKAYEWQRDAGERLARNFAEYWTEEKQLLAGRIDFEDFVRRREAFEADLAGLETRATKLEKKEKPGPGA